MNIDTKSYFQTISKQNSVTYAKNYTPWPSGFYYQNIRLVQCLKMSKEEKPNDMIISIETEKALNKIQYSVMILK